MKIAKLFHHSANQNEKWCITSKIKCTTNVFNVFFTLFMCVPLSTVISLYQYRYTAAFWFYNKMRVFLCNRKVYVLLRNERNESNWMTFDIDTQHWKVFNNDLSSRCHGSILNIRNVNYFFSDMCEKVHKFLFFVHMILLLGHRWQLLERQ